MVFHVPSISGVAALIIERNPAIDVAAPEELLYSTARSLGPNGRDSRFGFGLVDPLHALVPARRGLAPACLQSSLAGGRRSCSRPDMISRDWTMIGLSQMEKAFGAAN
jgi:hypothetical protein